ncbi:MAG: hypothetical protein FWG52_05730 [Proteobacteria bacterium]|nr:hypothetical protein [Pseudomonadota bacterium]
MFHAINGKPCSRKRQRGQAIYLALAAIVFLSLMIFAAFNISQMTHAKSQTMNAADAGAYTMAVTLARDMNFMAYTNRAMVANHAVVGQLVSLASLSNMIYLAARDISILQYFGWIPYIGPILESIGDAFQDLMDIIKDDIWPVLEELTDFQDRLIKGISTMQMGVHALAAGDMIRVENVIKANDPELEWAVSDGGGVLASASNVYTLAQNFFGNFMSRQGTSGGVVSVTGFYNGAAGCDDGSSISSPLSWWGPITPSPSPSSSGLDRMREVLNDSRDGFTIEREWVKTPPIPIPEFNSDYLFHGGTKMSCDNKTWVGVDGFEMPVCWDPFNFWDQDCETIRLWMTGEVAGSDGADDWRVLSHGRMSSGGHRRAYDNRHHQNSYPLQWDGLKDKYSGLQPYYDLTAEPGVGERPAPNPFVVLVAKPVQSNSTPNATQVFQTVAGNKFHLQEGRTKIYGVAAANVYFRRPAQSDNDPTAGRLPNRIYKNGTYATLFAPYWQARLTDLPPTIAAGLAASDGL